MAGRRRQRQGDDGEIEQVPSVEEEARTAREKPQRHLHREDGDDRRVESEQPTAGRRHDRRRGLEPERDRVQQDQPDHDPLYPCRVYPGAETRTHGLPGRHHLRRCRVQRQASPRMKRLYKGAVVDKFKRLAAWAPAADNYRRIASARVAKMPEDHAISLGPHFTSFVAARVNEGRYGSASEVVRAGLRLLEAHEMKVSALRAAIAEGEASGAAEPFDFEAFLARKRGEHAAE